MCPEVRNGFGTFFDDFYTYRNNMKKRKKRPIFHKKSRCEKQAFMKK